MTRKKQIAIIAAVSFAALLIVLTVIVLINSGSKVDVTVNSDAMLMDSADFNSIGETAPPSGESDNDRLDAASESSDEITASVADISEIGAAFSAQSDAVKKTENLSAFIFDQSIVFSLSVDGMNIDLEKTYITARSDGSKYVYSRVSSQKDIHNASVGGSENSIYGDKDSGICIVRNKFTDAMDPANDSDTLRNEKYLSKKLNDFSDNSFSFSQSDVANISVSSDGSLTYYKFIIDLEKGKNIVKDAVNEADADSQISASDIEIKYFVVSVAIDNNGYAVSRDVLIDCIINRDGVSESYEISSKLALASRDLSEIIVQKPSWAR